MKKHCGRYTVTKKTFVSRSIIRLSFRAEEISKSAIPGQFIQIRVSDSFSPLWPRPFSIYDADTRRGEISIIFKVAGYGTNLLGGKKEGDSIQILGPLGNGFPIPAGGSAIVMAAGGIGMPPLYLLSKFAIENGVRPNSIIFISGARNKSQLFDPVELTELNMDLRKCTDDGSEGEKGTVVDILERLIGNENNLTVYACGPSAMLKKIDRSLSEKNISGFLSLEELMPCGYGICSGCAVKVFPDENRGETDDNRDYHLKRVCAEGPVFKAGEVMWQ
ncbi:MAG: dihydroorotate dehydrogenase electron transfer subunit [Candidatus Zixiibacteriota bacterium]|nr:MAG: dihydroorotate dehydrogenase electron transfer subunit [candidate division Zixibacteria bacterium]